MLDIDRVKSSKVALICDWYLPRIGGIEFQMRDLARMLRGRGHEVHVITSTQGVVERDGTVVHRLDLPMIPGLNVVRPGAAAGPLRDLLERERFDVVHCHTLFSLLSLTAAYLARQMGVPCVFTEHSVLRDNWPLLRVVNALWGCTSWPDVMTGVSGCVARELGRLSGRGDVLVLPNGIDVRSWQATPPLQEELRITSVMRLVKRKQPLDIIRAIPAVLERLPADLRPRFTIIGDGPERGRVEREARRLGVSRHVELLGFLTREEIKRELSRSAMFILPTVREALSIATLEARCVGLPVVAMNHGGVGDLISHGQDGFLANDWDEFIGYIVEMAKDRSLRRRMSESTLQSVGRFSWEQVIRRHEEAYALAMERCRLRLGSPLPKRAPRVAVRAHSIAAAPLPMEHDVTARELKAAKG